MEIKHCLLLALVVAVIVVWRQTAKSLDRLEDLLKELSDTVKKL
jgi:HAMP domain-containing protein